MEARVLTEEEFLNLKASPGMQAITTYLYRSLEGLKSQWAQGLLSRDDAHAQKEAMDSAIAQYRCIEQLIQLDYEQYSEVMNDDDYIKRIGAGAKWPGNLVHSIHARTDRVLNANSGSRDVTGVDEGDEGDGD